jgi:hypothetical protein
VSKETVTNDRVKFYIVCEMSVGVCYMSRSILQFMTLRCGMEV